MLIILPNFLAYVETRKGAVINDPVLNLFAPLDVTWFTFIILYGSILFAIFYFLPRPVLMTKAIATYGIMVFFRIIAMFILPLDPPAQMIALKDPFVESFGQSTTLTRDLFFSGHTAIMFIFFLVADNKKIKRFLLAGTIAIAILVLLQHVHYSVDVFVAFFVAYASYAITQKLIKI